MTWSHWRAVSGTVLIFDHDLRIRLNADGQPGYIGDRRAAIVVWFSESIHTMMTINLCSGAGFGINYRNDDV